jgi:GT2 family glycosyltransferase
METVHQTCFVDWLPTGAIVWRREVLEQYRLDDYFEGYSYLEDLDFSFSVGKHYRLAVVADARYHHYPSSSGRISQYKFGRTEVLNRLYFVRKHGLSVSRCYLGIVIRFFLTLLSFGRSGKLAWLQRACGNVVEFGKSLGRDVLRPCRREVR